MSDFVLSKVELQAITGYKLASAQLEALHRAGFYRARLGPAGSVILERAHYDAVLRAKEHEPDPEVFYSSPPPVRKYEGSGLQRWAQARRAATEEAEERMRRYRIEHADELARAKADVREQYRLARPALIAHHANKRRAAILKRTPAWANERAIKAIYAEAARLTRETGIPHHVDHDIPLQGRLVSGLHVQNNLKVLPASENIRKRNKFEIEP